MGFRMRPELLAVIIGKSLHALDISFNGIDVRGYEGRVEVGFSQTLVNLRIRIRWPHVETLKV